jgi:zinc transport system permease protein
MFDFLQYDFVIYAFLIGIAISISASLLSPFLVFNQQALIADGLAHVSFAGIILGTLLIDEPLYIAVPFVMLSSILIRFLSSRKSINGDAAIGLVSAVSFAIGLILVKQGQGFSVSIESMLVGNIFTASTTELVLSWVIALIVIAFVLLTYRSLLLITYDSDYATFSKVKVKLLSYLLAVITSFFIVIGVRTIGVLLISALTIFPSVIASLWSKSFKSMLLIGTFSSAIIIVLGIFLAHPLEWPVGSTIVLLYSFMLLVSIIIKPLFGK